MFYAHISDDKRKQTVREHLDNVAELRLMIINAKLIGKRIKEVRNSGLCEKNSVKTSTAIKKRYYGAAENLLLIFFYSIQWILQNVKILCKSA